MAGLKDFELGDKLEDIKMRYEALGRQLSQPDVAQDVKKLQSLGKEHRRLQGVVESYSKLLDLCRELDDSQELVASESDSELVALAQSDIARLVDLIELLKKDLLLQLLPQDPNDNKGVILEIRQGTGGDEAALFCGELFRAYGRMAERKGWRIDLMSASPGPKGGYKEVIVNIEGDSVYAMLKFESGVHRVQRVPQTETQGRVHTSAVTVAVLPEAEDIDVDIDVKDLRIDVYRSSGPGGQSVNTTDSAVRITHVPTGVVVACQDERSQVKNKARALKILRARLLDTMIAKRDLETSQQRRSQVKSGDRSEKIRTYNFPQDRLTDHRIGLTVHNLPKVMQGELDEVINQLRANAQAHLLKGDA